MRIHLLAAVAAAMLGAGPALAQDFQFASYSDIQTAYQAQNQEIANLRHRLASLEGEAAAAPEAAAHGDYGCCNGGCCNGCGCDTCCGGCCDSCFCSSGCGWVGGVGLYWVKPNWSGNDAFVAGGPGNQVRNYAFDYDYEIAPLAWVGYVGDTGFGVRARWWEFDHSATVNQGGFNGFLGVPVAGVNTSFQNNIDLDVWDLEATQSVNLGCVTMVGSAGIRYLHIAQRTNTFVFAPGVGSGPAIFGGHNFDGYGPTLSLELRRAVGCSGLALYGNARGSILFGDELFDVATFPIAQGNPAGAVQVLASQWTTVQIAELELGAEYRTMVNCSTMAFARAGLVGQMWHGVGNTFDNQATLGFYGLRLETGINY
jgi:hypothetical protein